MREEEASSRRFGAFVEAMQGQFGRARRIEGELVAGDETRTWFEWEGEGTRVRAVDQSHGYGFFAVIYEDRATVAQLATLRTAQPRIAPQRTHALVDAVTRPAEGATDPDSNPDIVDRITGKIRSTPPTPAR